MGLYLNWAAKDGTDDCVTGKAARLRERHGAIDFEGKSFDDVPEGKLLVGVVENRDPEVRPLEKLGIIPEGILGFDAAGICRDDQEFREMTDPEDDRTVHLLLLDRAEAEKSWPKLVEALEVS
jgi:hypothetical protein